MHIVYKCLSPNPVLAFDYETLHGGVVDPQAYDGELEVVHGDEVYKCLYVGDKVAAAREICADIVGVFTGSHRIAQLTGDRIVFYKKPEDFYVWAGEYDARGDLIGYDWVADQKKYPGVVHE